jgi:hypothetical protein
MAYTRHFQLFKTVLLVAGLRAGRPGEEKPVLHYSHILLISSIIPPTVTHKSGWEREKWLCARPMAYTRHFQLFKTVLLVAGLRAGGSGAVGRCSAEDSEGTGRKSKSTFGNWLPIYLCSPEIDTTTTTTSLLFTKVMTCNLRQGVGSRLGGVKEPPALALPEEIYTSRDSQHLGQ